MRPEIPNRLKRVALVAIVNHHLLETHHLQTYHDLAEAAGIILIEKDGTANKSVHNFLREASEKDSDKIYEYFRVIVANDDYYNRAPAHIQAAIREVYDFQPDRMLTTSLDQIFGAIMDHDKSSLDRVSRIYSGIWDVLRYANRSSGSGAWITRAAMRIYPRDSDRSLPTFLIHYRPGSQPTGHFFTVKGCIISLPGAQHMFFIGYEVNTNYPLDIIAIQTREHTDTFLGAVRRKHEKGEILMSRVIFRRSKAKDMSELDLKIGSLPESEFTKKYGDDIADLDTVLLLINNKVSGDGKACLKL
jgi:hypothetical protein